MASCWLCSGDAMGEHLLCPDCRIPDMAMRWRDGYSVGPSAGSVLRVE